MKKSLYLIVGSAVVIGALLFLRKKKVADNKTIAEQTAIAEKTLKSDFDVAVHNAGVVQAEAMNIDLINLQKGQKLMPMYDFIWKQIFSLGSVNGVDKRLTSLLSQKKDLEKQVADLGLILDSCPRCQNGSTVRQKT